MLLEELVRSVAVEVVVPIVTGFVGICTIGGEVVEDAKPARRTT
jgi:hypothetical protein